MIRTAFLAVLALVALASNVEARQRHKAVVAHSDCNVLWPCAGVVASPRGERIVRAMHGFGVAQKVYKPRAERQFAKNAKYARRSAGSQLAVAPAPIERAVSAVVSTVSGIVAPLAAKVAEIQSACGSRVVSGVRHSYIAGTRRISLHASGKAVDMAGNPGCIYARLAGWPGGYSIDYARMAHVHLSYDAEGGREMGVHFRHGGGGHRKYARRHHRHRYASAR